MDVHTNWSLVKDSNGRITINDICKKTSQMWIKKTTLENKSIEIYKFFPHIINIEPGITCIIASYIRSIHRHLSLSLFPHSRMNHTPCVYFQQHFIYINLIIHMHIQQKRHVASRSFQNTYNYWMLCTSHNAGNWVVVVVYIVAQYIRVAEQRIKEKAILKTIYFVHSITFILKSLGCKFIWPIYSFWYNNILPATFCVT